MKTKTKKKKQWDPYSKRTRNRIRKKKKKKGNRQDHYPPNLDNVQNKWTLGLAASGQQRYRNNFFFFFFLENIITAGLAYPLVAVASGYYPYLYPSHTRMQKKKDR